MNTVNLKANEHRGTRDGNPVTLPGGLYQIVCEVPSRGKKMVRVRNVETGVEYVTYAVGVTCVAVASVLM